MLARPGEVTADPVFNDLLSATSADDLTERASRHWLDISAPTDARPFFFNQLRLLNGETFRLFVDLFTTFSIGRLPSLGGAGFAVWGNVIAMSTLLMLIAMSLVAVVLVIIVPARAAIKNVERRLVYLGSLYFLLIGLGFMFIEIGLIQRMSVVLGHPIYALGVVLFSIILSTGVGSLLSERFMPSSRQSIVWWLALLVIYVLGLPYWLPELAHSVESASLTIRCIVTVMVILPAGILMGFGFPFGMRVVMTRDARPTPWFWAINGAGGVFAAGLAVAWSITFSVDATLRFGGTCYLILLPTALLLSSSSLAGKKEMLLARA